MKPKFYRCRKNILSIAGLMIFSSLMAGNIDIRPGEKNRLKIQQNTYFNLEVENTLATIKALQVNSDAGVFTKLIIPAYSKTNIPGSPELPVQRKLIEVPMGASLSLDVLNSKYRDYKLSELGYPYPVMPAQSPVPKDGRKVPFEYDQAAYQLDSFYPAESAKVEIVGTMRSIRIGRLDIFPVQYNPVQGILRVYEEIRLKINFEGADPEATMEQHKKLDNQYFHGTESLLLNYKVVPDRDTLTSYPVTYLIVSDRMFESQLQEFIDWKTKKGFNVIEAYTDQPNVGTTTNMIKNYIRGIYNNPPAGMQAPTFVLFVGDIAQIPAWTGNAGGHVTDLYYCEFTGDFFPEIYYGRFSAQSPAQLQPQIDKTLQYEMYSMPDPSYLNEVVMIGGMDSGFGPDWANGQINYGTINYFNADHGILSHTYLYPESGSHSDDIIQDISNGVTFANYTAHGSPGGWADPEFSVGDIPTLQNQDKYGLLIGNACSTSEYQESECFAEAIVRAENKGALAYIGASNSTYWDEDYYFGVGVGQISENPPPYEETTLSNYDRAFHTHGEVFADWYTTTDQHIFAGNLAVTEGSPGSAEYYWEVYCVMGDPSLMVYYSEPPEMEVSYLPLMPLNTTSFTVNADPYAYVGISLNGVLHGAALANAQGEAVVPLVPITVPGTTDVIVTCQNRQPYIGTVVTANPDGPYILLDAFQANEILGNSNGKLECNEVITLNINLRNYGNSDGNGLIASLSSTDENIVITDASEACNSVPAQSVQTYTDAFSFVINENIPDNHEVIFNLTIEDGSRETWNSEFKVTLKAPVLQLNSITVNDNESGNGNGRLDPGESADIIATFSNAGHSIAANTIAYLIAQSGFVSIENPDYAIGNLGFFGNTPVTFHASVDSKAPEGILANFNVQLRSGAFLLEENRPLKIGLVYEDFESGDFTAFGWNTSGNQPWTVLHDYPYQGYYNARSGIISDNQNSELSVEWQVMRADSISFIKKVSSESGDKLKFYIDNQLKGEWSGTTGGWQKVSFPVYPGNHIFKWVYAKNASSVAGADAAWLDYIVFPNSPATTLYAGDDASICGGEIFLVGGQATGYSSLEWTTSGSGTFSNNTVTNPVYTPSDEDIYSGEVILSLTVIDSDDGAYTDDMTLSIEALPGQADMPVGDEYVNLDEVLISEYFTEPFNGDVFLNWSISPPEAGTIVGKGMIANIVWNREFAGTAYIYVVGSTICGEGPLSEGLEVMVDNPLVGLPDKGDLNQAMHIWPNPSNGFLNIAFKENPVQVIKLRIINLMGQVVYNHEGREQKSLINLQGFVPGIYLLFAEDGKISYCRKFIIR